MKLFLVYTSDPIELENSLKCHFDENKIISLKVKITTFLLTILVAVLFVSFLLVDAIFGNAAYSISESLAKSLLTTNESLSYFFSFCCTNEGGAGVYIFYLFLFSGLIVLVYSILSQTRIKDKLTPIFFPKKSAISFCRKLIRDHTETCFVFYSEELSKELGRGLNSGNLFYYKDLEFVKRVKEVDNLCLNELVNIGSDDDYVLKIYQFSSFYSVVCQIYIYIYIYDNIFKECSALQDFVYFFKFFTYRSEVLFIDNDPKISFASYVSDIIFSRSKKIKLDSFSDIDCKTLDDIKDNLRTILVLIDKESVKIDLSKSSQLYLIYLFTKHDFKCQDSTDTQCQESVSCILESNNPASADQNMCLEGRIGQASLSHFLIDIAKTGQYWLVFPYSEIFRSHVKEILLYDKDLNKVFYMLHTLQVLSLYHNVKSIVSDGALKFLKITYLDDAIDLMLCDRYCRKNNIKIDVLNQSELLKKAKRLPLDLRRKDPFVLEYLSYYCWMLTRVDCFDDHMVDDVLVTAKYLINFTEDVLNYHIDDTHPNNIWHYYNNLTNFFANSGNLEDSYKYCKIALSVPGIDLKWYSGTLVNLSMIIRKLLEKNPNYFPDKKSILVQMLRFSLEGLLLKYEICDIDEIDIAKKNFKSSYQFLNDHNKNNDNIDVDGTLNSLLLDITGCDEKCDDFSLIGIQLPKMYMNGQIVGCFCSGLIDKKKETVNNALH